jgi:dTDP-4-dehydrorhamnose reductase
MRVALTGPSGRLGAMLAAELQSAGHTVFALTRGDLDLTSTTEVTRVVGSLSPEAIVNCAAYNAVDAAQSEPGAAYTVNAHVPALLASVARTSGAILMHFSTDFVFDGRAREPYGENDATNPLSVYGASKLAGEHAARHSPRHYIFRVESLFGGSGVHGHRATVDVLTENLATGRPVKAFEDRTVTLSYVPDVARAARLALESSIPSGTYHCVNSGATTWADIAMSLAQRLRVEAPIERVRVADVATPAPRPQYCALSNWKLGVAGIFMPDWGSALDRHVSSRVIAQGMAL